MVSGLGSVKNCTDEVQPVDAGYGFAVRSEVGKQFMLWLDTDDNGANFFRVPIAPTCALNLYLLAADLWHSSNGMPAYLRRVLLTRWVGEVVRIINADTDRMCRMFERTGCAPHHSTTPHHSATRVTPLHPPGRPSP